MLDRQRLIDDCETVSRLHSGSMAGELADQFLYFIQHPDKLMENGYALVRKPELLGKGVPQR